jgi:hypothetical protein
MGKKMKKSEKKKSIKKEEISNKDISEDNNNINDKINKSFKGSEDLNYKDLSRILENDLTKNISPDEIINNKEHKSNDSLYKSLQNNYLKNTLNINLISMITKLIKTSNTIPKELKANYPLNNILMEIVKEFMLTDLEIVYLSLYLDIYGWESKYFDIKDNLILTTLSVKKYLNADIDIIETHLYDIYENIDDKFSNWIKSQKNKKNVTITPRMVNERNNLLKKPFNCYCRNNYIDYDNAVDKILHLSLSYNEINKHTNKVKSKNQSKQIIDFTKEENNK